MRGAFLGPAFSNEEIERFLKSIDAPYQRVTDEDLYHRVADALADEKVIGWLQGRMEFGLLADAASLEIPAARKCNR